MGLFIDWPRGPTPARDPLGECRDTMDGRRLAATRRPPRQIQAKRAVQSHLRRHRREQGENSRR